MKKHILALVSVAALTALASSNAMAQQAGDWVLSAGWMNFYPNDSSTPLAVTYPRATLVPGSGASVSGANTLGLTLNYFFASNWALEGIVGIPPRFKLQGTGTLASAGELGKARQWSPTLLFKYYFFDGDVAVRPFVGIGGTYVWYDNVKLTSGLAGAVSQMTGLPAAALNTTASLKRSFAPVFSVGASWQIDKHWGAALSFSYIPLKTTATLNTSAVGIPVMTSQATLTLNPLVTYLAVSYKF
ncbi:MAG: outer membrane beta-barrel protein [Burkholderiaceae bacterium]|jgi:outer membrane protein|nr:outer membrane beta-barrel protein [Burkholderiaceae bacterium]